ncbi:hypothetical protein FXO37_16021 [Capsicum annuum]|nr:hypothetical protein FXO37_16021 [Capsicum annuum]
MPEDHTVRLQMSMAYCLLKHRIKYMGDDKDSKERKKRLDEIWISYCGMPICFSLKEFTIVTTLICDRPKEPLIKETPPKVPKQIRQPKHYHQIDGKHCPSNHPPK